MCGLSERICIPTEKHIFNSRLYPFLTHTSMYAIAHSISKKNNWHYFEQVCKNRTFLHWYSFGERERERKKEFTLFNDCISFGQTLTKSDCVHNCSSLQFGLHPPLLDQQILCAANCLWISVFIVFLLVLCQL